MEKMFFCILGTSYSNYKKFKNMTQQTSFWASIFKKQNNLRCLLAAILFLFCFLTNIFSTSLNPPKTYFGNPKKDSIVPSEVLFTFIVPNDVKMGDYFTFMNNVTRAFDSILPYKLTEHILVRYNSFIIDSLVNTDYYRMKTKKIFVNEQKKLTILKKGTLIYVPTLAVVNKLKAKMAKTYLDVNIPEYKLRVMEGTDTVYTFPIRVGQVKTQFAPTIGRDVDMRTRTGIGFIANIHPKDHSFDPIDGKKYAFTTRDDGKVTVMPLLPWLEPKINNQLRGQWIHATTNPRSLGKAYSNGCMGTSEADIWRIYYYAPIDTKVVIRYDLTVRNEKGEFVSLRDVYGYFTSPVNPVTEAAVVPQK
jgi:L,D-transpeptidase ErfK/SrfK